MADPINVAVVGLGRVAHSHIDGILQSPEQCELAAVVDIDADRARAASERYDAPYYTDTEAAFSDPSVDAVVVCVPHHLHAPVAVEAMEAGKHVLVEKVMATSLEAGERMVAAAEERDVNLMVGQSRRFFPSLREAKDRIEEIGTPLSLEYTFACHFDADTAPPWWRSEKKTGGLVYPMLGSHSIDYTLWMLDDRDPVAVYAAGASTNDVFEGDDEATLVIEFDDGTHATNVLSINTAPSKHRGLVVGAEGSIAWDQQGDHSGELVGVASTDLEINGATVETPEQHPHNFTLQMRSFAESITNEREPEASGREILTQLRLMRAAKRSATDGRRIQLDE